jgi:erythromycin esterase-like protein
MIGRLASTIASTISPARDSVSLEQLRDAGKPLTGARADFDPLIARIGEAALVLIGEASHGTAEFYRMRAQISRRLIVERGFTAVAVEADWPDAYRVNRFVRGGSEDADATSALDGFRRFPTWMWRNTEVRDFIAWLRAHNDDVAAERKAGFYGLDLYSLHTSIDAVLSYLDKVDPAAARRARYRYACFDHYGDDVQAYGYAASFNLDHSCEEEVVDQLVELRRQASSYAARDGRAAGDELFFAEQNARLVRNAEAYYRSMFQGRVESWNLRDTHMMEMLQALRARMSTASIPAKIIVWAHNSHLGDARATEMGRAGELNLGQLVREHAGDDAVLIGFSTYTGSVTAASDWDEPAQRKRVRPGLPGSYEALLHAAGMPQLSLDLKRSEIAAALHEPRLQRAIGVIYRPETERQSHYFRASVCDQFDWLLHLDQTSALEPLEPGERWHGGEPPEAYPSGL